MLPPLVTSFPQAQSLSINQGFVMRMIVSMAIAVFALSAASAADRFNAVEPVDISKVNTEVMLKNIDRLLDAIEALERNTPDDERLAEALDELDFGELVDPEGDGAYASALLCKVPPEQLLKRVNQFEKIAPRLFAVSEFISEDSIGPAFVPSLMLLWTNVARTVPGCEQQALQWVKLARRHWTISQPSERTFFEAAADTVELGLRFRLDVQKTGHSTIDAADMLRASKAISKVAESLEFDEQIRSLQAYATDLERVIATRASPIWQVRGTEDAKLRRLIRRCGYVSLGDLDLPAFPSPTEFLYADGQKQAAAAWALAKLFRTEDAEVSRSDLNYAEFVFAAYGRANTALEIERAARSIRIIERKNAPPLAYISFFEHQFIIESGADARSRTHNEAKVYTASEIESEFRASSVFRELGGK